MGDYAFAKTFTFSTDQMNRIWPKLQTREMFTRGQIFPYKVEFDAPDQQGPFQVGELNIHHGPLLSVHGQVGEITSTYRDLKYFYGSYVLSFRWIRPYRLQMFREGNQLTIQLDAFIKKIWKGPWVVGNHILWWSFGWGLRLIRR